MLTEYEKPIRKHPTPKAPNNPMHRGCLVNTKRHLTGCPRTRKERGQSWESTGWGGAGRGAGRGTGGLRRTEEHQSGDGVTKGGLASTLPRGPRSPTAFFLPTRSAAR